MMTKRSRLTGVTNTLKKVRQEIESNILTIPTFVGCTSHALYTITGKVHENIESGAPVKNCKILIDEEYMYDNILTNEEGEFAISGLIHGDHVIDLICDGFLPTTYTFNIPDSSSSQTFDIGNKVIMRDVGQRGTIDVIMQDENGIGAKAELYRNDSLVQSFIGKDPDILTFKNLPEDNSYVVKISKQGYQQYVSDHITLDTYTKSIVVSLTPSTDAVPSLNESIHEAVNNFPVEPVEVLDMVKITSLKEAKELLYHEGDHKETNPLFFAIEEFFEEVNSPKTDFESRWVNQTRQIETADTVPYIYVIDLGMEDDSFNLETSLLSALELYSVYEDTELLCVTGLDTQNLTYKAEVIAELMELLDELWIEGKCGNVLTSFKGQTEHLPQEFLDEPKYFNKNLINVLDYNYLGHVAGRYCLTPVEEDLGFIPFRSLNVEDIPHKVKESFITARNNGLLDIRIEDTSFGYYPRIELGVNTLYALGTISPESKVHIKRIVDYVVMEVDKSLKDFIKMEDTRTIINVMNTTIKRVIMRFVNREWLDESSFARVVMADKKDVDAIVELKLVGTRLLENIEVSVGVEWAEDNINRYYTLV